MTSAWSALVFTPSLLGETRLSLETWTPKAQEVLGSKFEQPPEVFPCDSSEGPGQAEGQQRTVRVVAVSSGLLVCLGVKR